MALDILLSEQKDFFFWLILCDTLSTRALLKRKGMFLEDYNCVFCSLNLEEDLLHLLFHCPSAMACWYSLQVFIPNLDDISTILESLRTQLGVLFYGDHHYYVLVYLDVEE
jgi:hypothetical protein